MLRDLSRPVLYKQPHLDEDLPYDGFSEVSAILFVLHYFLEEVSVVRIFHHNAK